MTRILCLSILFAFSCKTEIKEPQQPNEETKVFKKFDYRITVDIWNGFYGYESKFILDNSLIDHYDSSDANDPMTKPLTLYVISFKSVQNKRNQNIRQLLPIDTTEIAYSRDLSDTLFNLTRNFLKSVDFNNVDTLGQLVPVITDDSHGMIELSYGGKKLSATISSINNPSIGTKQLDTLLNFIAKFRPDNK